MVVPLRLFWLLVLSASGHRTVVAKRTEHVQANRPQADATARNEQEADATARKQLCRVNGPPETNLSLTFGMNKGSCKFACSSFAYQAGKIMKIFEEAFKGTKIDAWHKPGTKECVCQDATTGQARLPPIATKRDCNPEGCWRYYQTVVKQMFVDDTPGALKWKADNSCNFCGGTNEPACESTSITASFGLGDLAKRKELANTDAEQASELQKILRVLKGEGWRQIETDRATNNLVVVTKDSVKATTKTTTVEATTKTTTVFVAAVAKPSGRGGKNTGFVPDDDDEEEEEDEDEVTTTMTTTKDKRDHGFADDDSDEDDEDEPDEEEDRQTCPNLQAVADAYQAVVDRFFSKTGACKLSEKHLNEQNDGRFGLSNTKRLCSASCIKSFVDKPMILPDVTSKSILRMGHCDESDRLDDLGDLIKVVEGVVNVGRFCK